MRRTLIVAMWLLAAALPACHSSPAIAPPPALPTAIASPAPLPTATAPAATATVTAALPTTTPAPTPFYAGPLSPPCGVVLPPLPLGAALPTPAAPGTAVGSELRPLVPAVSWPAMQRLFDAPSTVGLVAYQLGREAQGVYWNADTPMPLASVAKVITLVAYVEAVAAGELQPLESVPLADLERFYLPGFDLGAHRRALNELRAAGRVLSPESDPAVRLEDVPWMMIRHSSNAAADYLQQRLGQTRIEATTQQLGLAPAAGAHTAPCSFLGQFLMMANHIRGLANDSAALSAYLEGEAGAADYGRELALLADAYTQDDNFRAAEIVWRDSNRRPTIETQRAFTARLAPRGTARAYAGLMARLAQNGLSNADSSYQARRYLEWPNQFPANQEVFSNVGYKNGTLPGALATIYYAYRWGDPAPVVVALFYRDLPQGMYRDWRRDLPHDELARWLLADPSAIPALAAALQ